MCNDGEVRFYDRESSDQREGRVLVEMCFNGVWGTVCADEITTNIKVCSQLGISIANFSMFKFVIDHQLQ